MPRGDPFDTPGFGTGDTFTSANVASGSSTPTARSIDVKGGHMQVADIAARDAITGAALAKDDPDQFRQEGMIVYVADKGGGVPANYQLQGGITNADWVELTGIGSGGGSMVPRLEITVRNNTASPMVVGELVAVDSAGAAAPIDVVPADGSVLNQTTANVIAVIAQTGGLAIGASGIAVISGLVDVLFKTGLAPFPVRAEDVNLSEVAGRATTAGDANTNIPSGGSLHKIGTVVNADNYDGIGDDLVTCIFAPGQRRVQP